MAKTKHGLPETKGSFKLVGLVTGVGKEDFFVNKETRNGSEMNTAKFGVKTSNDNEVYVQMSDMERDEVYFYRRRDEKKGIEAKTQKVAWSDREDFNEEGFTIIGVNVGIEQEEDEKGKMKNVVMALHGFDGAKYLDELSTDGKFKDSMPVRAIGDIEYSSFDGEDGKIRFKKFAVKKLYNSKVDFESDDFSEESDFKQEFIYMSTEFKEDEDGNKYALVSGKIVTYSSIEDAEFVIRNKKLATNFQKKLKPYTAITVHGKIVNRAVVEEVVEDDDWGGESDPFERANYSRKFELEIKGIKKEAIDTEKYTEEKIKNAMKAEDDFGSDSNEWDSDDDDDGGWD